MTNTALAVLLALTALLGAVSAASVLSPPLRHSREGIVEENAAVINDKSEGLDAVNHKSVLTDIVQAISDSVSHVTGQAATVTGEIFNSAFGGLGGVFQAIQSILSGKPVATTTTTTSDGGTGSVVFLVHSKPNE